MYYGCPLCHPFPNIFVGVLGWVVFGYGWIVATPAPGMPVWLIHTAFALLMFMSGIIFWFGVSQARDRKKKCH